ncbi:DNAJA3 isoform 10 [Pan troglodytes]|uniref:DNAJA3 isoform 10 n=1 Tax=Pan troglodytes TaxID=9598 RepID=A0A2J8LAS3_PANTR|nr:DNAJA3 isoform 10 [Pan troglodytes]
MAARCSTRWLLVVVGTPRLPAISGRGARPPREGVVGAWLSRKLSVPAFASSLTSRGPRALLTLRPGVSLTGGVLLCRLGWSAMARSWLTATSASQEQNITLSFVLPPSTRVPLWPKKIITRY